MADAGELFPAASVAITESVCPPVDFNNGDWIVFVQLTPVAVSIVYRSVSHRYSIFDSALSSVASIFTVTAVSRHVWMSGGVLVIVIVGGVLSAYPITGPTVTSTGVSLSGGRTILVLQLLRWLLLVLTHQTADH